MIDIVVPTIGRASLRALLASLARSRGPQPARVILVDDRRERGGALDLGDLDGWIRGAITVVAGKAAGPASARNIGWRASRATWIAFLDDDVVVSEGWLDDLARDLRDLPADVAGSHGNVTVPLPAQRRPTDWERNVAGLASALWITADCAYRRSDLAAAGGFDERFRRAYREDADLGLRIVARGKRIVRGSRRIDHPVRPADWKISLRLQAGNADDVLMDALHGRSWRRRASSPRGAFRSHAATVLAAALASVALVARKPRLARSFAGAWALLYGRFAWRRIAPGPRTSREVAAMLATSAALPFCAVYHRLRGYAALPALLNAADAAPRALPSAVLFDRDGTLVVDVPYNGDPQRVEPMPGAREAVASLRAAGIAMATISNQSGVALGRITRDDVDAVNHKVAVLLGPVGPAFVCTHGPTEGCRCRKPAPGLVEEAARALGVAPEECVVVGDIGADVEAAYAAGARAILVPSSSTLVEEIDAAPVVARNLREAVELVLGGAA